MYSRLIVNLLNQTHPWVAIAGPESRSCFSLILDPLILDPPADASIRRDLGREEEHH